MLLIITCSTLLLQFWFILTKFVIENIYFDLVGAWAQHRCMGHGDTSMANPSGVVVANSQLPLLFYINKLPVLLSKL